MVFASGEATRGLGRCLHSIQVIPVTIPGSESSRDRRPVWCSSRWAGVSRCDFLFAELDLDYNGGVLLPRRAESVTESYG